MPVRILLADKSITIQKVVEMLFSGREYEVVCVSDGEAALSEAERMVPDLVLADVDLPRVDGYGLASRLKTKPAFSQTPIILMMSRDDIYDTSRGKQAGIFDNIAKPFESQELIGKVKKALAAAPPRHAEPAAPRPIAPPRPAAPPASPSMTAPKPAPAAAKAKPSAPADIFDIISEAPAPEDLKKTAVPAAEDESLFEVEPVVEEMDEPLANELEKSLPVGAKAMEEMRAGLGLMREQEERQPEIATFTSFDMAAEEAEKPASAPKPARPAAAATHPPAQQPAQTPMFPESELRKMAEKAVATMAKEAFAKLSPPQIPMLSESDVWGMAEATVAKMAQEVFKDMAPPIPKISEETVRRGIEAAVSSIAKAMAREVIEKVAWEVIPPLAEYLIRAEIERLKAEP